MKRWSVNSVALLVACAGCGDDLSLENRPCPCTDGYTCCALTKLCVKIAKACVFEVTPSSLHLRIGAKQQFQASPPVTWSVDEPTGGNIDAAGLYHAPLRPSTSVIVGPSALTRLAGIALPASLNSPTDSTILSSGALAVTDSEENVVLGIQ